MGNGSRARIATLLQCLLAGGLALPGAAGQARAAATPSDPAALYARHCAACHGRDGAGNGAAARDLHPPPRDFTRGQFRFRGTASGSLPLESDLEETIRRGLPGTAMPAFEGLLSASERAALARHIMEFAPETMRASEPVPVTFAPPSAPSASPSPLAPLAPLGRSAPATSSVPSAMPGASGDDGKAVYLFLQCWTCHGLAGNGRGSSFRGLTDETGSPIRPTDFRYAPFKGGRDVERVMRDLLAGLSGTPMPSYADVLLYAREDVEDLTSFADALSPAERESLARVVAASPDRAEIEGRSEASRQALRDERAAALARYVLSFEHRHGFSFRLFRERPELEPRSRPALDASGVLSPGEGGK